MRREATSLQRLVRARRQIGDRIEQRTVQIKYN